MSAVNELERRLDADRPHAGPDERTETFHEVKLYLVKSVFRVSSLIFWLC